TALELLIEVRELSERRIGVRRSSTEHRIHERLKVAQRGTGAWRRVVATSGWSRRARTHGPPGVLTTRRDKGGGKHHGETTDAASHLSISLLGMTHCPRGCVTDAPRRVTGEQMFNQCGPGATVASALRRCHSTSKARIGRNVTETPSRILEQRR